MLRLDLDDTNVLEEPEPAHLLTMASMAMRRSISVLVLYATSLCISVVAFLPPAVDRQSRLLRSMPILRPVIRTTAASLFMIPDQDMEDRFDRWRVLQNILDLDIAEEQVEALVDVVLAGAVSSAPKVLNQNKNNLTSQLYRNDILALERLYLPDPDDDKDAFDSLWDTVAEIHGRDAVKLDLKVEPRWPYVCCLVRILLQYDFLTRGINKETIDIIEDDALLEDEVTS